MEKEHITLSLDTRILLNKIFEPQTYGYNAQDVDEFLDLVINDYHIIENNYLLSKKTIDDMEKEISELKHKNEQLTIENKSMSNRLKGIKDNDEVNSSNIDLLKKIDRYERKLYKMGIDPKTV